MQTDGRVELPDEQWAQLDTNPTHDQMAPIFVASVRASEDPATAMDLMKTSIAALLLDWKVTGKDGKPLPANKDGIGACPAKVTRELWPVAQQIIEDASPNVFGPRSTPS